MVSVTVASPSDYPAWDIFVKSHPYSTPFHTSAWISAVKNGLKHQVFLYIARNEKGEICGGVPILYNRSLIFGNHFVASGGAVYGGLLANTPDIAQKLAGYLEQKGHQESIQTIELRHTPELNFTPKGWVKRDALYATFRMTIPESEDENLKAIPRKKRADLRKALVNNELHIRKGTLDEFYNLYALNLHQLGTPVQSKAFYGSIQKALGNLCEITTITHHDKPVCSLMSFVWKDTIYPYYIGSSSEARKLHAYDLMYWHIMRHAVSKGLSRFDFGRSKRNTGAFDYKKLWGIEPESLPYAVYLVKAKALPEINPLNPDYARAVVYWKKLPLWVANTVGPFLARQIP